MVETLTKLTNRIEILEKVIVELGNHYNMNVDIFNGNFLKIAEYITKFDKSFKHQNFINKLVSVDLLLIAGYMWLNDKDMKLTKSKLYKLQRELVMLKMEKEV